MQSLNIAVLTVSDTRGEDDDTSGAFLVQALTEAGHRLADRKIVRDDIYQIRALLSAWIADPGVEVALVTGGTGFFGPGQHPGGGSPPARQGDAGVRGGIPPPVAGGDRLLHRAVQGGRRLGQQHRDFLHARFHQRLPDRLGRHHQGAAGQHLPSLQFRRSRSHGRGRALTRRWLFLKTR